MTSAAPSTPPAERGGDWPRVSVVAVNYRQPDVTADMLDTLRACTYPNLEVVVVDNGCERDESARWAYHYPGVVAVNVIENLGFAGGTNLGIRRASGELVLMLNNDTLVEPDFLEPMVELLRERPAVGMVSPKIVFADPPDTIQYAGAYIGQPTLGRGEKIGHLERDRGQYDDVRDTQLPHGACMLVRRHLFDEGAVGMLPEFYFMYFEEHDFAVRARRLGYGVMYCGRAKITHRQSLGLGPGNPRKTYYLHRNRVVFYQRLLDRVHFAAFLAYYLAVGVPLGVLRFARAGRFDHIREIGRALRWNAGRLMRG